MNKLNFNDSCILITGASSGIGKEFAKQLAAKGANLILTARNSSELGALANALEAKHKNIFVKTIPADLSELNSPQELHDKITALGVSVDYLINNAGVGKFCEFTTLPFEHYQKMMMLNMQAVVALSHLCLPAMKTKNNGGIINVASTGSFQPLPYQSVYGATKSFVLSFSEALSGELLDSNIRVMALCPGATESGFMEKANADTSKMALAPADKVVSSALTAFDKNKMYTVSGKVNYFTSLIPRIISRKNAVKIVADMFKNTVLSKAS